MTATTSFTPRPTLRLGDWATLGAEATTLRMAVFVQEQGIPAELEVDEMDALALHAVAYGPQGQAVATGRLLPAQAGQARVGRMAVARTLRGQGWAVWCSTPWCRPPAPGATARCCCTHKAAPPRFTAAPVLWPRVNRSTRWALPTSPWCWGCSRVAYTSVSSA